MKTIKRFLGLSYRRFLHLCDRTVATIEKQLLSDPKAVVLTYHRVTILSADPLFLAVRPETFEQHLIELKKHFDLISIDELVQRIRNRSLAGREIAITFDDGYKDNMTEALPIARAHEVPLTVFISTAVFDTVTPFTWDDMYHNGPDTYLTKDDAAIFSHDPLVTIGSHTVHHPRLRELSPAAQQAEISGARETLASITGKPIEYMAYPFGGHLDINAASTRAAKDTGHSAAFTTIERAVRHTSPLFALPRLNVREMSAEDLIKKIQTFI